MKLEDRFYTHIRMLLLIISSSIGYICCIPRQNIKPFPGFVYHFCINDYRTQGGVIVSSLNWFVSIQKMLKLRCFTLTTENMSTKNFIEERKEKLNGFSLERKEWKILNRYTALVIAVM